MPRKVPLIEVPTWYVPDIDTNRKDPDPMCVLIKPLSRSDKGRIGAQCVTGLGIDASVDTNLLVSLTVEQGVQEVRNYTVGTHEIKTAKDLLLWGEEAIVSAVFTAVRSASELSAGELKN